MTASITNTPQRMEVISLYNSDPSLAQYIIYNLFRILKPIRLQYKVSINELVILNGIYVYHKVVGSSFSKSSIRKFNRYYNNKRSDYYVGSLLAKGLVDTGEIQKGIEKYKLSPLGFAVCDSYNLAYDDALKKFISDNNIMI